MASRLEVRIGADTLLLDSFSGSEELSRLFSFKLEMFAENERDIRLDALVGKSASFEITLPDGRPRTFNGIVSRISQGARGMRLTSYRAEIVPRLWLLTRISRSRIFQRTSVPDIVMQVLGSDASVENRLTRRYEAREYCVQYRESDFDFASRLMEEEGIFYFFKHSAAGHTLVLADTPAAHPDVIGSRVTFDPNGVGKDAAQAIVTWEKTQELRSGMVTLRDHNFQLPEDALEATAAIRESVQVGQVTHMIRVAGNEAFEVYDYPGGYAAHFDGVDKDGGEQPAELQKIFEAARQTAATRMDEEAVSSVTIDGSSNSRQLAAGYRFVLAGHPNGDGAYVLTSVRHRARVSDPQAGARGVQYENEFTCIPEAMPFRPARATPRPTAPGTQTAVVVGPAGEEIFPDKYARVKVQFHWDRLGKKDEDSSCWIRVAQPIAGSGSGTFWLPEVDDEVLVVFEQGDPDRPYIVGAVFNPRHMPPRPPVPR